MTHAILGLDVGGANLKAAHCRFSSAGPEAPVARSTPFALWRQPADLPRALRALVDSLPAAEHVALTMTGELCDCFESKRQGVLFILDAVASLGLPVQVFGTDGRLRDLEAARANPLRAASANWLALTFLAGQLVPFGPALLVDIGSTTTDVVPLLDGQPVPRGRTDPERLRCRELVYTGVRRTPLCALLGEESAAELFATTLDAYLVLGRIAEDASDHNTADGRPGTRACAHARLARMLCADLETSSEDERLQLARTVFERQTARIETALGAVAQRLPSAPRTVVVAGEGAFLAEEVLVRQRAFPRPAVVSLERQLGAEVSRAACAFAVAALTGIRG